jgi:hypothetical protein
LRLQARLLLLNARLKRLCDSSDLVQNPFCQTGPLVAVNKNTRVRLVLLAGKHARPLDDELVGFPLPTIHAGNVADFCASGQ